MKVHELVAVLQRYTTEDEVVIYDWETGEITGKIEVYKDNEGTLNICPG